MDPPGSRGVVADTRHGAVLRVRVRPRSSRRGVLGIVGGELSVGVGSPPEGGRATSDARRAIAEWLGVAPSRVTLASGATSRSKRFLVGGYDPGELRALVASKLSKNRP